jgi:histidine triad (HIT) family protein
MSSIFSRIISGEIPSYKIAENEECIAILDINPLVMGHVLVIPKKETDYIFDIEDKEFAELHLFSKKVAKAIEQAIPCKRIGVAVIGLEVPHAHIHLIPLNNVSDINFSRPKLNLSKEELEETAKKIREQLI